MNEEKLIKYYNKFNEDKRLKTRHGQVEFITTIKYIDDILRNRIQAKIIDIGAGTGAYSIYLANKGHDVTAIELVKHNLKVIEQKTNKVKTILGNATHLDKIKDESFDLTLLLGPMYHLLTEEEKIKALYEAKRITKKGGFIMVAYLMNEYGIIIHGFRDKNIIESKNKKLVDNDYKIKKDKDDLYSFMRIEDINRLNDLVSLKRIKIITPDGPSNYIRSVLNKLTKEEFEIFIDYHLKNCERQELIGAGAHTLDILKKV